VKKFDGRRIIRMSEQTGLLYVYKPFPGKYPIRLLVQIRICDEQVRNRQGNWFTRFQYNGHWSYSILRKALRIWNALLVQQSGNPHLLLSCRVTEYCQTGALYSGDLFYGHYTPGHAMSHLFSGASRGSTRIMGDYCIEKKVPVRCGNFSMMVPEAMVLSADTRERKNILYQEMRKTRKRWEAT
jgi:hypothetical protein